MKLNDTHRHKVGDPVLRTIGSRLKKTVSRHGGDECLYLFLEPKKNGRR